MADPKGKEAKGTYIRKTRDGNGGYKVEVIVPKPKPQTGRGLRYSG